jgi:hypothetical protein
VFRADLADGVVDDALDFIGVGIGVARSDVLNGALKHAPADGFFNELREIALFHAMSTQEGAQGQIGVLRDLKAPADGFFFHLCHLYAQIDKRSNVYTPIICPSKGALNSINSARENLPNRRRISLAMIGWRELPVTLTIDLPDAEITALAAKARARGVSAEEYARQVLEHDLAPDWLRRSWESAAQAGLNPLSMDEIDAEIAAARKARRERPLDPDS